MQHHARNGQQGTAPQQQAAIQQIQLQAVQQVQGQQVRHAGRQHITATVSGHAPQIMARGKAGVRQQTALATPLLAHVAQQQAATGQAQQPAEAAGGQWHLPHLLQRKQPQRHPRQQPQQATGGAMAALGIGHRFVRRHTARQPQRQPQQRQRQPEQRAPAQPVQAGRRQQQGATGAQHDAQRQQQDGLPARRALVMLDLHPRGGKQGRAPCRLQQTAKQHAGKGVSPAAQQRAQRQQQQGHLQKAPVAQPLYAPAVSGDHGATDYRTSGNQLAEVVQCAVAARQDGPGPEHHHHVLQVV